MDSENIYAKNIKNEERELRVLRIHEIFITYVFFCGNNKYWILEKFLNECWVQKRCLNMLEIKNKFRNIIWAQAYWAQTW